MERTSFPHLSDAQYEALTKMFYILGSKGMQALVQSDVSHQIERIGQYMSYENALLEQVRGAMSVQFEQQSQQAIAVAQEEMRRALTAQFERQAGAAVAQARQEAARQTPTQRPLMLSVPSFEGNEGDNLLFWFKEIELAFKAVLITSERIRVTFAMSKLAGRAKTQLFRMNPSSLEDAMEVAIQEDYCHKQAHASVSAFATPMEVNSADNMRCFQCGSVGHMKRDCPRRFTTSGTRGRRYGKQQPPRKTETFAVSRCGAPC
jgi:hypothetical protein